MDGDTYWSQIILSIWAYTWEVSIFFRPILKHLFLLVFIIMQENLMFAIGWCVLWSIRFLNSHISVINRYPKREVHNLARFISVMKFQPLSWRANHPYVLVDRFEDVTPPERVHTNNKCDRNITLYGYLRGCNLKYGTKVPLLW